MRIISLLLVFFITLMPISFAPSNTERLDNTNIDTTNIADAITVTDYLNQQYENVKGKKLDVSRFKAALPFSIKFIISDTDEVIFIKLDKTGLLNLPESIRKVDFEVTTTSGTFFEIIEDEDFNEQDLKGYIKSERIQIVAHSFKAQVLANVLEEKYGFSIVKKKTFRQKTIAFIAAKFASLFTKKNA
ncbi:hypothetical protein HYX18_00390 [Candidatus Woesearchaeota archaeon]|nr:hypothetical protein [Candidatus Woesearchaeota archaeon]